MRHLQPIFVALLLTLVAAPRTEATDTPVEAEIVAFFDTYAERAAALDWDGLLALYADDARFHWMESGHLAYDGKASVVEHIHTLAPMIEQISFEVLEPRILVLSEEHAHASLRFRETVTLVSGESLDLEGAITALLVRTAGGWRLLSGHTSISPPEAASEAEA